MLTLTKYQQQRLARRKTSDITKLTDAYTKNINAATSDYETAFADYNSKRDALMAPYNQKMDQYKADYSVFEQNMAGYKQRMADYVARLEDVQKNPLQELPVQNLRYYARAGYVFDLNGQAIYANNLKNGTQSIPDGYTFDTATNKLYKRRDAGTFTEKAPVAPTAPTQPEIPEFDSSQFEQKKAALETDFKREVGERKAGRLNAVSRSGARPMLQGAKT